jgi:hypothetical protein
MQLDSSRQRCTDIGTRITHSTARQQEQIPAKKSAIEALTQLQEILLWLDDQNGSLHIEIDF